MRILSDLERKDLGCLGILKIILVGIMLAAMLFQSAVLLYKNYLKDSINKSQLKETNSLLYPGQFA